MGFLNLGRQPGGLGIGATDPNAATQMPRLPYSQNDAITMAAIGMIGQPSIYQGMQNAAQMIPAGLASNTAKRRDMYSMQETAADRAAMNAILKLKSNQPITPQEQAAIDARPEIKFKYGMPAERDKIIPKGSLVWDEKTQTYVPAAAEGPDAATNANIISVRKELASKEGMTRYNLTQPVLQSMANSVDSKSAMSDFDFVYGMAQIYDPTSVVRDKEQNFVLQGQSIPEQWKGLMQKVLNGQAELGPDARRRLVNATRTRVESYRQQAERELNYYTTVVGPGMSIDKDMLGMPLADLPAPFEVPDISAPPRP